MILSRFALIIRGALPRMWASIFPLIIEELAGGKNPGLDSFSGASYLIFDSCRQPRALSGKMEERSKRWNVAERSRKNFVEAV